MRRARGTMSLRRVTSDGLSAPACGCLIALLTTVAPAAAQPPMPAETLEETLRVERITRHQRSMQVGPMSEARLARWEEQLRLDDAQRELLTGLAEPYQRRFEALQRQHGRKIDVLWSAAFRYDRRAREVVGVPGPALIELLDARLRLLEGAIEADRTVFNGLRARLDRQQTLLLRREEVARAREFVDIPPGLREADIDLVELVSAIELDERERELVAQPILAHLERLGAALRDAAVGLARDVELARANLLLPLGPYWELLATAEDALLLREQIDAIDYHREGLRQRIVQTVWQDLFAISERLSVDQHRALMRAYIGRLWPDLLEETERVLAHADAMRRWLPSSDEEPGVEQVMGIERERLINDVHRMIAQLMQSRFNDPRGMHAYDLFGPGPDLTVYFEPHTAMVAEVQWLSHRIAVRSRLLQYAGLLQNLNQALRPEDIEDVRLLREALQAAQSADQYRNMRIRDRYVQVMRLLESREAEMPNMSDEDDFTDDGGGPDGGVDR